MIRENRTGKCEKAAKMKTDLEPVPCGPYKQGVASWRSGLRSGLQIRRRESQKFPTIQQHKPAFPALANLRKIAEHAGNVRNAGRAQGGA